MSDKRSVYGHCQLEPSRIVSRVMIGLSTIFFTLAGSAAVWAQLSVVSSSKIQGVVREFDSGRDDDCGHRRCGSFGQDPEQR